MCRFLLAKSKKPISPASVLEEFAAMAKNSKALDGDWQGDGWGISTLNENGTWVPYHSLKPVWEDTAMFGTFPQTNIFVVHARSASFPKDKGILNYNQPYIDSRISFVFNGLLKGVSFDTPIPGAIGAQKIFSIIKEELLSHRPGLTLTATAERINRHTKEVQALNMGLSDGISIIAYCQYDKNPEYYQLYEHTDESLKIICSEVLPSWSFSPVPTRKVLQLT